MSNIADFPHFVLINIFQRMHYMERLRMESVSVFGFYLKKRTTVLLFLSFSGFQAMARNSQSTGRARLIQRCTC